MRIEIVIGLKYIEIRIESINVTMRVINRYFQLNLKTKFIII